MTQPATRAEKIKLLEKKAADLIQWFVQKPAPVVPFQLNAWTVVNDQYKYFKMQLATIGANAGNPYNINYINAFKRLAELKNYMENVKANNGQPAALRKISQFGNRTESNILSYSRAGAPNGSLDNSDPKCETPGAAICPSLDVSGIMRNDRSGLGKTGFNTAQPNQKKQRGTNRASEQLPSLFS
jgi:hypothetical protein